MAEKERLKSSMTIPKAIGLITDKQSVSFIEGISLLYATSSSVQVGMMERHLRALNRIAIKNKHGFVSLT